MQLTPHVVTFANTLTHTQTLPHNKDEIIHTLRRLDAREQKGEEDNYIDSGREKKRREKKEQGYHVFGKGGEGGGNDLNGSREKEKDELIEKTFGLQQAQGPSVPLPSRWFRFTFEARFGPALPRGPRAAAASSGSFLARYLWKPDPKRYVHGQHTIR